LEHQQNVADGIAGKVILQTRTEVKQHAARFNVAWQMLRAIGLSKDTLERVRETGEVVRTISIVSPINGVIAVADVRAGQIVQPTEHLYHIVDPSRVWLVGRVLEADAGKIKQGLPVQVTFAMLPAEKFASPIDHIELRLNDDRTLSVKVLIDNSAGLLKPGMFGQMEIQIDSEKAVVCPKEALIRDGISSFALVQQSAGNFVRKWVTLGASRNQAVEIEDGLFPGDKVVTVGSHELAALFASRVIKPSSSVGRDYLRPSTVAQGRVELPTDQKTFASAPIEGRILQIFVEHGQPVKRGAMLAEIESLPFKTLQLDFLQALTNLRQASQNLERVQTLSQSDAVARKDLWQLQTQRDTYQQAVASLHRKLALVGLSDTEIGAIEETDITGEPKELTAVLPIRAPVDGLIAEFELAPGRVVTPQSQLFELHNPATVWVQAFLFEQDAIHVKAGQAVQVRLVSDPTFRASGKVDRLNPVLFSGNRALSIWTELENPNLQLKEGMSAILAIDTATNAPIAGK
jgi:multidrug resistance efflux pump